MRNKLFEILKNDGYEVNGKKVIGINVNAKKYFEDDADRLEESKDTDYCLINIDFENETAEYCWIRADENPGNYPYENDSYKGVCELLEELYLS